MNGPFPILPADRRGTVRHLVLDAPVLRDNPWGDPSARDLFVHVPRGHEDGPALPVVLVLPGFAGTGEGQLARGLGEPSLPARLDALFDAGCPPFLTVLPDVMTSLGGSQYVDSPAIGAYLTWLVDHVRPFIDAQLLTTGRWAAAGRSSGGLGAFNLAVRDPGTFRAIAMHAADSGFDLGYLGDIPPALRALQRIGGPAHLVEAFWSAHRPGHDLFAAMNLGAMACAYAPQPGVTPWPGQLPFDWETGEIHFDVLQAWRAHDPVVRATDPAAAEALGSLDRLFVDAGTRDEYGLHLGARRLVAALRKQGVSVDHEEFDGGHRGTAYRYDRSLPLLAEALHGS